MSDPLTNSTQFQLVDFGGEFYKVSVDIRVQIFEVNGIEFAIFDESTGTIAEAFATVVADWRNFSELTGEMYGSGKNFVIITDSKTVVDAYWDNFDVNPQGTSFRNPTFSTSFSHSKPDHSGNAFVYLKTDERSYYEGRDGHFYESFIEDIISHELGHIAHPNDNGAASENNAVAAEAKFQAATGRVPRRPYADTFISNSDFSAPTDPNQHGIEYRGEEGPARTLRQGSGFCFATGTPIMMADNSIKPIESVQIGDCIASFNCQDACGPLVSALVTAVHVTQHQRLIKLADGTCVTPGHVFLSGDKQFDKLGSILERGGTLVLADGSLVYARTGRAVSREACQIACAQAAQEIDRTPITQPPPM